MQALDRGRGFKDTPRGARFCYVLRTYITSGVPVCDVIDEFGGVWWQCLIRGEGADENSYHYSPPTLKGVDVNALDHKAILQQPKAILLIFDGDPPKGVVIGGFLSTQAAIKFEKRPTAPTATESHPRAAAVDDDVKTHAGARVVMAGYGGIVLDHREVEAPVRVELSAGGAVRFARDGKAEDNLVPAEAMQKVIADMSAKINALTVALNALGAGLSGAADNVVKAAGSSVATAALVPYTPPVREEIASAAFQVPKDTLVG